ncbi:MAG: hypothetical protein JWP00_625 [Chloroflexi bacterium]|nr:hypothetical protein [Chloroflexota bacterium]
MQETDSHNRLVPPSQPEIMDRPVSMVIAKGPVTPETSGSAVKTTGPASNPQATLPDNHLHINYFGEGSNRYRPIIKIMLSVVAVILITMVPLSAVLGLLTAGDVIAASSMGLAVLVSVVLIRVHRVEPAGYVFILGALLALLMRSWLNIQVDLSGLLFNYFTVVAIVVLSGLILQEVAPFVITGVAVVGFGIIFLQVGFNNPAQSQVLIQMFVLGSALHVVLAVMSWVNARTINRAVRRMHLQNDELKQVNRRLERNLSMNSAVGDTISQLAADLLQISHEQSNRANLQAQSVVIVTSTLEELSATARQVAEVADNVYSATEQALHTAETGGKAVGFGIDSIATLTDQVETISKIANELGTKSRRISEIVETIAELAEETNLLALNATIEAAGAGEYGRRFAVVAQEVQFLATRSRAASRDVQSILGQIRTSINNTLKATDEGLIEAQRMSEVASQAGEALEQIIENVEGTTYLAHQINLTTQQQRTATDQAVEMIRQVAGNSRETNARAQQLLLASDRLNQTAASLRLADHRKAET